MFLKKTSKVILWFPPIYSEMTLLDPLYGAIGKSKSRIVDIDTPLTFTGRRFFEVFSAERISAHWSFWSVDYYSPLHVAYLFAMPSRAHMAGAIGVIINPDKITVQRELPEGLREHDKKVLLETQKNHLSKIMRLTSAEHLEVPLLLICLSHSKETSLEEVLPEKDLVLSHVQIVDCQLSEIDQLVIDLQKFLDGLEQD